MCIRDRAFRDRLGAYLVQPHKAVLAVGLFGHKAYGKVAGLVVGRADEHAVVVDLVAEDHLLNDQRQVGQTGGEGEFGVGIEDVALGVVKILDVGIVVLRGCLLYTSRCV